MTKTKTELEYENTILRRRLTKALSLLIEADSILSETMDDEDGEGYMPFIMENEQFLEENP